MISTSHRRVGKQKIAFGLSLGILALGISVLVGWTFNIAALINVLPGLAQMKPNTALTFVLSGLALVMLSRANPPKWSRYLVCVLAGAILSIGVLTLVEYFLDWNPGFDLWLYHQLSLSADAVAPGRMSPTTAFCSILMACALVTAAQPTGGRFRQPLLAALGVAVMVIGCLSLAGYIALAAFNWHLWNNTGVAAHTALADIVLGSILLLLAYSDGKLSWVLDLKITLGFWFAVISMLLAAGLSFSFTNKLLVSDTGTSRNQETLKEVQEVMTGLSNLQSSQRGYVITGNESLLAERATLKVTLNQDLGDVRQLTVDNPGEQQWLDQLLPLIMQRLDFGAETIRVRRQQGFLAAQARVADGRGDLLSGQITILLKQIQDAEYAQLALWQQESVKASTTTLLLQPLGVFLSLTLLSLGVCFLNAGMARGQEGEAARTRLAAIVEHSSDAIIGKDLNSIVTSWNNGAQKIFGYSAKEMVGQSIMQLIPSERQGEEEDILSRIKRGESVEHFETVRLCKDGTPLNVSVTVSPIKDAKGSVVGASKVVRDITERSLAEKMLKASMKDVNDLKTALDEHAIVAMTDPQGRITFVNDKFCAISKYSREELLGQDHRLINSAHHSKEFIRDLWTTIAKGRAWHGEIKNRAKDGSYYWVDTTIMPFLNEQGKPRQYVAIRADITERKKAEEALKLFRTLVDQSNDAFEVIEPDTGRFLDFNEKACSDLGYTRQELLSLRVFDITNNVSESDWPRLTQLTREKGSQTVQTRHVRKDGTSFPIEVNVKHVQLDREYLVSVVRDITDRQQAEEILRESEERFRQLAENIREVFWMTEPAKNKMVYISPAYEAIWGRSCQSLYESPHQWFEAIHPADRAHVLDDINGKQERGEYDVTYRILRPGGTVRWIHDQAFPIRNQAGQVYRIVGTATDITEYRKLEEQYRQAQKMEALGTLAGGIAHDFNNILAAVKGYTELTRMEPNHTASTKEHLDAVLKGTNRAIALVRQILTFSRRQEQERSVIQLQDVVGEALKLLRVSIPAMIEFEVALAPDAPAVLADSSQIHQVIMNLGTNAAHAMKDKVGRLTVKLENFRVNEDMMAVKPHLRTGHYVRISVSDTGCGMDETTLSHIFEPFFTTKAPGEGTGLGLAVVHGIMHSHEGAVTVYSHPGEGTTFHLYFPANERDLAIESAPQSHAPHGQGERILYVDDEQPLATLGKKILERLGYVVNEYTNPAEALAAFRAEPAAFSLVVTDQMMPGITGTDLSKQIHDLRPDLPIILTTGYTATLTPERIQAIGIKKLLLKPLSVEALGMLVHRVLADAKPR